MEPNIATSTIAPLTQYYCLLLTSLQPTEEGSLQEVGWSYQYQSELLGKSFQATFLQLMLLLCNEDIYHH
jgi:hypothetical protein